MHLLVLALFLLLPIGSLSLRVSSYSVNVNGYSVSIKDVSNYGVVLNVSKYFYEGNLSSLPSYVTINESKTMYTIYFINVTDYYKNVIVNISYRRGILNIYTTIPNMVKVEVIEPQGFTGILWSGYNASYLSFPNFYIMKDEKLTLEFLNGSKLFNVTVELPFDSNFTVIKSLNLTEVTIASHFTRLVSQRYIILYINNLFQQLNQTLYLEGKLYKVYFERAVNYTLLFYNSYIVPSAIFYSNSSMGFEFYGISSSIKEILLLYSTNENSSEQLAISMPYVSLILSPSYSGYIRYNEALIPIVIGNNSIESVIPIELNITLNSTAFLVYIKGVYYLITNKGYFEISQENLSSIDVIRFTYNNITFEAQEFNISVIPSFVILSSPLSNNFIIFLTNGTSVVRQLPSWDYLYKDGKLVILNFVPASNVVIVYPTLVVSLTTTTTVISSSTITKIVNHTVNNFVTIVNSSTSSSHIISLSTVSTEYNVVFLASIILVIVAVLIYIVQYIKRKK